MHVLQNFPEHESRIETSTLQIIMKQKKRYKVAKLGYYFILPWGTVLTDLFYMYCVSGYKPEGLLVFQRNQVSHDIASVNAHFVFSGSWYHILRDVDQWPCENAFNEVSIVKSTIPSFNKASFFLFFL